MQSARAAVAPGVPAYLVTRPSLGSRDVLRGALQARLRAAVDEHRVCLLLAPAGYGKTRALTSFAERDGAAAWLSLTDADHHVEHLSRSLASAVAGLELVTPGGPAQRVLIIDDVHLAGSTAAKAVLRPFLEHPPNGLRLLLAGRSDPGLGLARLRAAGNLAVFDAAALVFTTQELRALGRVNDTELTEDEAAALLEVTGGWPVAARLALLAADRGDRPTSEATAAGPIPHLPEYLFENVLAELPERLSAFVAEAACVCDWVTAPMADELLGRTDSATLLEAALAAGLPMERRESVGTPPVYGWHPLMSASARVLLRRRDPALLQDLERRAAHAMASRDPVEAATHALRARDPELASSLIRTQWLAALLRGDSEVVEELCAELPAPWSDDPEILAVRAACLRNSGEAERAAVLDRRARTLLSADVPTGTLELTVSLARLFVIDSEAELAAESARVRDLLTELTVASGPLRACALLLVGWTHLRLRAPSAAVPLLREAVAACRAEGLDDLADRAKANESFALAFGGDFRRAREGAAVRAPEQTTARWRRVDGAIEQFTAGWIQFWSGDAEAATDAFTAASDQGGGLVSYTELARCWLTNAAVDTGDPRRIQQFLGRLELVPDETIQGLPWHVYKGVARAGSALVEGRPAETVRLLDEVITGDPHLPAANVLAAQLYWACGARDKALGLSAQLLGPVPGYLQAGALVIEALAARGRGEQDRAHELLESALALSAPDALVRPFLLRDPDLTALLVEHPAWGTRHEALVATCLTRRTFGGGAPAGQVLTSREREILSHLSTTMTTDEIAATLHITANTLKTHLKSVYRKLGVANRREAVAASRRAAVPSEPTTSSGRAADPART